jgi:predicted DNA binding CopG/RHH family protein
MKKEYDLTKMKSRKNPYAAQLKLQSISIENEGSLSKPPQNKRVNIKVSESDLTAIQKAALQQGIPYQIFITSILHKYASGTLYEVSQSKSELV